MALRVASIYGPGVDRTSVQEYNRGMELSGKQEEFVRQYLLDKNGTQSAIRAGYTPTSAKNIASRNLKNPRIRLAIERASKLADPEGTITADWVERKLLEVVDKCMSPVAVLCKGKEVGTFGFDAAGASRALAILKDRTGGFNSRQSDGDVGAGDGIDVSLLSDKELKEYEAAEVVLERLRMKCVSKG